MKLPKNYFTDLTLNKYREHLKLLPNMQKENTRILTTLIFTFFALSFFGIFAIRPTITTIVELRKKLADNQLVSEQLKTKINNLSSLQSQYNQLGTELPIILEAIPQNPNATQLLSQILGLARQKNITISSLETSKITLAEDKTQSDQNKAEITISSPAEFAIDENIDTNEKENSFRFTLQAQGSYEELIDFAQAMSNMQRIINIESISIGSDQDADKLSINIEGSAYFQK